MLVRLLPPQRLLWLLLSRKGSWNFLLLPVQLRRLLLRLRRLLLLRLWLLLQLAAPRAVAVVKRGDVDVWPAVAEWKLLLLHHGMQRTSAGGGVSPTV